MAASPIFEKIGQKIRQDSREITNARLPQRLLILLEQLARADDRRAPDLDGAMRKPR